MPVESCPIVIVGAGAAGLMAAMRAAERGGRVLLLEKNRRPGVKILMSGGTRCNITQATNRRGIIAAFGRPGKFLHSPLAALPPEELVAFFNAEGVATKVEPTGKIFPRSDKARDVLDALLERLKRSGAELALERPVTAIAQDPQGGFRLDTPQGTIRAERLLITTGGKSYPGSGTTGDAYTWLAELGHTIVPPRPALAPLRSDSAWVAELRGVTLEDVALKIAPRPAPGESPWQPLGRKQVLAERRSSLLFAHFGLTGPAALDVSRAVSGLPEDSRLDAVVDFLPDVSEETLQRQVIRAAAEYGKRQLAGWIGERFPKRLAEVLLQQAEISPDRQANEVSKAERTRLVAVLKHLRIPITGTLGFKKAEVTAGGVALAEVDSHTMQSKLVPGLYLAGEVLDLDGPIGGYNFQAAFSTGWLAGESLAGV